MFHRLHLTRLRNGDQLPQRCQEQAGRHEIDILLTKGNSFILVEIKSGKTLNQDYFKNIKYWNKISETESNNFVIYCGEEQIRKKSIIINWQNLERLFDSDQ